MYIRPYRPEDLDSLHALDVVCFAPPFRFSRRAMRRFAEAPNAIVRLACERAGEQDREALAGFCVLHLEPAAGGLTGYIVTLDVAPAQRGRGIAGELMQAMERAAAAAGASGIALHVFTDNLPAIRLYERLGYQFVNITKNFYGRALNAFFYQKGIAGEVLAQSTAEESA